MSYALQHYWNFCDVRNMCISNIELLREIRKKLSYILVDFITNNTDSNKSNRAYSSLVSLIAWERQN